MRSKPQSRPADGLPSADRISAIEAQIGILAAWIAARRLQLHHYQGRRHALLRQPPDVDACYEPNSFGGPVADRFSVSHRCASKVRLPGSITRRASISASQGRFLPFDEGQKARLYANIAAAASGVPDFIPERRIELSSGSSGFRRLRAARRGGPTILITPGIPAGACAGAHSPQRKVDRGGAKRRKAAAGLAHQPPMRGRHEGGLLMTGQHQFDAGIRSNSRRSKLLLAPATLKMRSAPSSQALRREGSVLRLCSMPSACTRFFWNARHVMARLEGSSIMPSFRRWIAWLWGEVLTSSGLL